MADRLGQFVEDERDARRPDHAVLGRRDGIAERLRMARLDTVSESFELGPRVAYGGGREPVDRPAAGVVVEQADVRRARVGADLVKERPLGTLCGNDVADARAVCRIEERRAVAHRSAQDVVDGRDRLAPVGRHRDATLARLEPDQPAA